MIGSSGEYSNAGSNNVYRIDFTGFSLFFCSYYDLDASSTDLSVSFIVSFSFEELIKKSMFDDSTNGSSREYLFKSTSDYSSGASGLSSGSIEKFRAVSSFLAS